VVVAHVPALTHAIADRIRYIVPKMKFQLYLSFECAGQKVGRNNFCWFRNKKPSVLRESLFASRNVVIAIIRVAACYVLASVRFGCRDYGEIITTDFRSNKHQILICFLAVLELVFFPMKNTARCDGRLAHMMPLSNSFLYACSSFSIVGSLCIIGSELKDNAGSIGLLLPSPFPYTAFQGNPFMCEKSRILSPFASLKISAKHSMILRSRAVKTPGRKPAFARISLRSNLSENSSRCSRIATAAARSGFTPLLISP
jgi:hypothetical protein